VDKPVVYPNPSSGTFSIYPGAFTFPIQLSVVDAMGKIVLDESCLSEKEMLDIAAPSIPGAYQAVLVSDSGHVEVLRIMVK
jgi:hypothetical protein